MDLKAVIFDAGNTLVFINPAVVLPIFRAHGAEVDEDRFWSAEFQARSSLSRRVEEGATGTEAHLWDQYFVELFSASGVPQHELNAVAQEVRRVHEESHIWSHFESATGPALERLKEAGYRMAVISNADGRVEGLIQGAGIRGYFEFVMDSELEGVEKPDPEIFLRGCRRLGVAPEEALYVGDLYPVDVLGARSAGMRAILLDPSGSLDYPVDTVADVAALPDYLERLSSGP